MLAVKPEVIAMVGSRTGSYDAGAQPHVLIRVLPGRRARPRGASKFCFRFSSDEHERLRDGRRGLTSIFRATSPPLDYLYNSSTRNLALPTTRRTTRARHSLAMLRTVLMLAFFVSSCSSLHTPAVATRSRPVVMMPGPGKAWETANRRRPPDPKPMLR